MAKKFDIVKDGVSIASDKNNYISLASVLAYKMFVAPRIPNAYLSNASTVIIPAVVAGFATQDRGLVEKMFLIGLAMGLVPLASDILQELATKQTDPAKRAKMQDIVYLLNGYKPETVSGVDIRTQVNGESVYAQYQPPKAIKGYNKAALSNDSASF